jgi:hypothetical protein
MHWRWHKHGHQPRWCPPDPIPDYDRVFPHRRAGDGQWSSLLGEWLDEPTQPLPLSDVPPETAAGRWRAGGAR